MNSERLKGKLLIKLKYDVIILISNECQTMNDWNDKKIITPVNLFNSKMTSHIEIYATGKAVIQFAEHSGVPSEWVSD